MSPYKDDRSFTNYVHKNLAIPIIYNSLHWEVKNIEAKELEDLDVNYGIDYVLTNEKGEEIKVQERFRDEFYKNYNDATLRYRRDNNPDPTRMKSEFYKIKADYLVYGITNGKKFSDKRHTLTDFIKWVVVDLNFLREKYNTQELQIITSNSIYCREENGKLYCPENFNPDGSSSFVPFDVTMLHNLWGDEVIVAQKGFLF